MYDAWNNGNVDRMIEFWWDDATWEDAPEIPDRRIIHGRENVEARLREVIQVIGDLRMEVVEIDELGDEVLGSVLFRVVGSASGVSLDVPSFHLIRFEGGRVRRYRLFSSREDALEAAESA
jgi:ketosteroid isomerase-like protein